MQADQTAYPAGQQYPGAQQQPVTQQPSPVQQSPASRQYRYLSDPTTLTTVLKTLLWIGFATVIISILSDFAQLALLFSGSISETQAQANDVRQQLIGLLAGAVFLPTAVTFMVWVHRANSNCRGFGAKGMKFTPGWAVGFFFVPIMSLYKPYYCMKEIWDVSSDPVNWQRVRGGALVGLWWMLWLISGGLSVVASAWAGNAQSIRSFQDATAFSIFAGVVDIVLYLVVIRMISQIFRKQENLVRGNAPRFE